MAIDPRERTAWVPMWCSQSRDRLVAVFRLSAKTWSLVSAQPAAASSAGGGLGMEGGFAVSPEYAGCPRCGARSYCKCHVCGELGCWSPGVPNYRCAGCGSDGPVQGSIDGLLAKDIS